MSVASRAVATNNAVGYTTTATTATVTKPTGTASGDLLVCAILTAKDTSTSPTGPSGWTMTGTAAGGTRSGANGPSAVFWHAAGASEGASYAFTVYASSVIAMWALTGANTATPITTVPAFGTATSTAVTAPTSTAVNGGMLLTGHGVLNGSGTVTFSTPTGMTSASGNLWTGYHGGAFFHQAITADGATGTRVSTASTAGTGTNQGMSVTIAPGAGGAVSVKSASFMPFFGGAGF